MVSAQTTLGREFVERAEAFVEGAIDWPGIADYIPAGDEGAHAAASYVVAKYLCLPPGYSFSCERGWRARELVSLIEDLSFIEKACAAGAGERASRSFGLSPNANPAAKAAEDERFLRWREHRRQAGATG